jgi:hypothetical protein
MERPTPAPMATVCVCEVDAVELGKSPGTGIGCGSGEIRIGAVAEGKCEVTSVGGDIPELVVGDLPPLQYPAFVSFERSLSVKVT